MFAFVLRGQSISGSHSISKQNDRGSEYFKIERSGGQKLGGSFDFVTPAYAHANPRQRRPPEMCGRQTRTQIRQKS